MNGFVLVLVVIGCAALALAFADASATTQSTKVKIALVGDSTVTENAGWGLGFKKAIGDEYDIVNFARGGRSSKSYRAEKHWDAALASKPQIMLIQFGHNDQKGKGPERETDPNTTFPENMARYVKEAREAGIKPVLVTSLTRRRFKEDGKIKSDHGDFPAATIAVAKELNVPLIDLHTISIDLFNKIGLEDSHQYEPKDKDGGFDATHLNEKGGEMIGKIMAEEFRKIPSDALK